ncbi:MAG TPA: class I SAM-dependent methyltransferase [Candidatus Acidoferrum sp.]|nr:class I SAM-dependent methyltransferase [Candidatus Acidoferrum sp.]
MKWILQNARERFAFALKNPRYSASSLLREVTQADEKFIAKITGTPPGRVREYLSEPIATPRFAQVLRDAAPRFRDLKLESADLFAKKILVQYAAVRALAPRYVVETGVANGVSSSYLLLALQKNGTGLLHSIGLDDAAFLPPGSQPGWLVPDWLRDRWQLHIGDARLMLPGLLAELGSVDIFIHDSLHTYEHMTWEFAAAYPFVRPGGLIFCDDALWNHSFNDFARKVNEPDAKIIRGVGFLRKAR